VAQPLRYHVPDVEGSLGRVHQPDRVFRERVRRGHGQFQFDCLGGTVIDPATITLPLHSKTPPEWGAAVLRDPIALLIDHAFLEKKAALNAMELMTRWPAEWVDGWVETMTGVARDEAAHLAQVTRILMKRGGRLGRGHSNPYAKALRDLVRKGGEGEALDRLLVSGLIEVRSCERFGVLAAASVDDAELSALYRALYSSELGHYKVFLRLARKVSGKAAVEVRWQEMLAHEARILAKQEPGPRIHSGI
jgi:tRNA-(ms[2]io[6]A)-hydroxylase